MEIKDALTLGNELLAKHNLDDWTLKLDNSKVRFGCCKYRKKIISLSKPLVELNSEDEVKDVILHEIAHALVPRGEGHSRVWKEKAISIGCSGDRLCREEVKQPVGFRRYECPKCKQVVRRHRKMRSGSACDKCCKKYNNGVYTSMFAFVEV